MIYTVIDLETRSRVSLKKVGAPEYARHPSTVILCAATRTGTREELPHARTRIWRGLEVGPLLMQLGRRDPSAHRFIAHYALFEREVLGQTAVFGPALKDPRRWLCTMSLALSHALPRGLGDACDALDLPNKKNPKGALLIRRHCQPRKPTASNPSEWNDDLAGLKELAEYCAEDVDATTGLFLALPPLHRGERKLWILNQRFNSRGVRVDRPFVKNAIRIGAEEFTRLDRFVRDTTGGISPTQRDKLRAWCAENGAALPNLQKKTVEDALAAGLAEGEVAEVLRARQSASLTSLGKYPQLLARSASDGRLREVQVWHGAATGRDTGTGVQVHNFPRGSLWPETLDVALQAIEDGDGAWLKIVAGDPMAALSSALRASLVASAGFTLFGGDFNAIEARVAFWLAGHDAGLKLFQDGTDLYRDMATAIYGKPLAAITDEEREIGKRAFLGCVAAGTPVLTRDGWVPIERVDAGSEIWDGREFVRHGGLVSRGSKPVMRVNSHGVYATPDHWILDGRTWRTAVETVISEGTQALPWGTRTVAPLSSPRSLSAEPNAVSACAAYAELKKRFASISFTEVKAFSVLLAPIQLTDKGAGAPETLISSLIRNLERVGSLVETTHGLGAGTLVTPTSNGTALAEFNGGSTPLGNSWNTLLRSAGLTNGGSRWIELITVGTMSPETYESLASKLTTRTAPTYDLKNCGPRNRFAVGGNLIAHNCGFGMGAPKFQLTCAQFNSPVSEELAKRAVKAYRTRHRPVALMWSNYERASIEAVRNPGRRFTVNRVTFFKRGRFLYAELPSGRRLAYCEPEVRWVDKWKRGEKTPELSFMAVNPRTKKWNREMTYGGKIAENVTQGVARDRMYFSQLRTADAGYIPLMSIHDELLNERKGGSLEEFSALMSESPAWAEGLPAKVKCWTGPRYKKA